MAHKVSMQQIADRLGVSKYTVSQALSGKEGVSEATRKEVIVMARALGYRVRKHTEASDLPPDSQVTEEHMESNTIPKVWIGLDERHSHERSFWQRVRQGIEAGSREYQLHPHFFTFGRDKSSVHSTWQQLQEQNSDVGMGFIMVGKCPAELLLLMSRTGLPVILVDHEEAIIQADAVLNANIEAGRMACHHLLSQGCRSIVFIGRDSFAVSFRERFWGCRLAVEEIQTTAKSSMYSSLLPAQLLQSASRSQSGIQLKKWTVPYGNATWRQSLERRITTSLSSGENAELAKETGLPDGFVCANDEIALALMQSLQNDGIDIPARCRVIGIDNTAASLEAAVPLTTVDLAKEWLGMRAVEAFVRRCKRSEAQYENITLAARLIIRASG